MATITAMFAGQCRACGGGFQAGAQIQWTKAEGSRHVACPAKPSAAPTVARAVTASVTDAPFEVVEKWAPCKRATFERQLPSVVGEPRRYTKGPPALRKGAAGEPVVGNYVVAGVGRSWYESAEDSEDMGDMSGAGWNVVLYLRRATEAEDHAEEQQRLAASMAEFGRALVAFVARRAEQAAREELQAAFACEENLRVEVWQLASIGEKLLAARETATRMWSDDRGSYISKFELDGATVYEYDWDQPTVLCGPRRVVEPVALAVAMAAFGWTMRCFVERHAAAAA